MRVLRNNVIETSKLFGLKFLMADNRSKKKKLSSGIRAKLVVKNNFTADLILVLPLL